ncbi:MAG: hypothetical protein ACRDRX_24330 [Pseudonocardiaceae bacterium]
MTENLRNQRAMNTKVVRKIVTTIVFGGLGYLITNLLSNDSQGISGQILGITISVIIGGVTLIVQYMIDFEHRLEGLEKKQAHHLEGLEKKQDHHSDEIRLQIENAFAKMSDATELFRAVEKPNPQTLEAMQLLRQATRIAPGTAPLVSSFAHSQIKQMAELMSELSEGVAISYDGEDRDWMLGLTTQAQETIDATSLSTVDAGVNSFEGGLWTSDLGQRYLDLQRLAVEQRNVQIRRVFIILDGHGQASDEAFQRIYLRHQKQGIKTRVLEQSQIGEEFKPLLHDFVVFDEVVSYEVTPASLKNEPSIINTQLILKPEKVRGRMEIFERLWESAREIL